MDLQVRCKGDGVNITKDYQRLPKVTFFSEVRAGGDILIFASGAGSGFGSREDFTISLPFFQFSSSGGKPSGQPGDTSTAGR